MISRRRLLKAGIWGSVLVSTGSLVALVRTSGYDVVRARARDLRGLRPWQYVFVQCAARRICASDGGPIGIDDPVPPTTDDADVAGFVDGYVPTMAPDVARDLGRFFAYVEHLAPLRLGLGSRFTRLPPDDQDRVLASVEASDIGLLRAGFDGLKSLVVMGYYRDPRTWPMLGYDGPLVRRPARGWGR